MDTKQVIIVTTINSPTKALKEFSKLTDWHLISVGDTKTPKDWLIKNTTYLSPDDHKEMFPKFSSILPWRCYGRKNIGYLYAIKNKAEIIAEIDDDIAPYNDYPHDLSLKKKITVLSGVKYLNIYKFFNGGDSWPRGFPINHIRETKKIIKNNKNILAPIQNSILDENGDFDAIYRLTCDKHITYKKLGIYALEKGVYCPFHSGNTFWYPQAYMLLYMPVYVNSHVEDIWRGYIAQRILWEIGGNLVFTYPTAYTSDRNAHDYMQDFKNELPLFMDTTRLVGILDSLSLSKDLGKSLIKVYQALIKAGIMKKEELKIVTTWVNQAEKLI